ncbi:hypothetical protein TARUN_475 [Trichoderma arundinaceum]|uniref:F-box domain-containing protein n=1 Tax=Trichoderma arundinaceum TaxID=490622 RepID=A0A395P112_TRIAR|nr:hypothetical protein TARUN_475 [Trichoderma arundinaceum]
MRFLFKRKDKKKQEVSSPPELRRPVNITRQPFFPPSVRSSQLVSVLPTKVLERIFAFVCPHAGDESYDACEDSGNDDGCMLCDLRDLAHCSQVNRAWHQTAVKVLYHSVRIDQVHYCKLEAWLAERRKQTRFDRNARPEDPAQARLRLFRRTVREDPTRIGKRVEFLKTPYQVREYCQVELAQTIAVLPSLKYVDLPEGMFSDESSSSTLRFEVQARCPNIRKMTYNAGSEKSFPALATGQVWPRLEVLELNGISVDTMTMRAVLSSLQSLRALKMTATESISDEVLAAATGPIMPSLEEFVMEGTPRVTAAGLIEYLVWPETQRGLKVLTLIDTGVHPQRLQEILTMAPCLKTLAMQAKVIEGFPQHAGIGLLASQSLEVLRYEISTESDKEVYASMKASWYTYLASSVLSGSMPRLRKLFVHDESFPEQLQGLPPPNASFAGGHMRTPSHNSTRSSHLGYPGMPASPTTNTFGTSPGSPTSPKSPSPRQLMPRAPEAHRFSSNNPFAAHLRAAAPPPVHTLEVYTKTDEFGKWNFSKVDALTAVGPALRRPVSSYGLAADVAGEGWNRGEVRRSIMVGDGSGLFLPLPPPPGMADDYGRRGSAASESWRPSSSGGDSLRRPPPLWQ